MTAGDVRQRFCLPRLSRLPRLPVNVSVVTPARRTISARFVSEELVATDAVMSLDEDATLMSDELDFVYQVSGGGGVGGSRCCVWLVTASSYRWYVVSEPLQCVAEG